MVHILWNSFWISLRSAGCENLWEGRVDKVRNCWGCDWRRRARKSQLGKVKSILGSNSRHWLDISIVLLSKAAYFDKVVKLEQSRVASTLRSFAKE